MSEGAWLGEHDPTPDWLESAFDMDGCATHALAGRFGPNLWGFAIRPDHAARAVDVFFHFEDEPTELDRYEMGEFYSTFEGNTAGRVDYRHHRVVGPRVDFRLDHSDGMRWLHLSRHPGVTVTDGLDAYEIDY